MLIKKYETLLIELSHSRRQQYLIVKTFVHKDITMDTEYKGNAQVFRMLAYKRKGQSAVKETECLDVHA